MKILAVDQARAGAWSIYDYESKTLLEYGIFDYPSTEHTYAQAVYKITDYILDIINSKKIEAVFIEDINLRRNVDAYKKLAWLQGSLVSALERNEFLYDAVAPSKWQSYCNARGRTAKEVKAKAKHIDITSGKKQSKMLSIQFVKEQFGIETDNDNLADSIALGWYVVNNVPIEATE